MTLPEQTFSPSHSFAISDVFKYGSIEKALIMKEIKGMSLYKIKYGEECWTGSSGNDLIKKFPYMKASSVNRWMRQLEEDGYIKSRMSNKHKFDNTKSYLPVEIVKGGANK